MKNTYFKKNSTYIFLVTFSMVTSCSGMDRHQQVHPDTLAPKIHTAQDASIPGNFSGQTQLKFDSSQLALFLKQFPEFISYSPDLRKFYQRRSYAYAWYDSLGRIESSMDLYNRILNMKDEGVPFKTPRLKEYQRMIEGDSSMLPQLAPDPMSEMMMTAQYFNYARQAWGGISEEDSKKLNWFLPRKQIDYASLLDSMTRLEGSGDGIGEPLHRQYTELKGYLRQYRKIELSGGLPPVKADKKKYTQGDSGSPIAAIRKSLFLLGDLARNNESRVFDAELKEGVKAFQRRYGQKDNGEVGESMIQELNTPIATRIRQIVVNMERSRWMPAEIPKEHLVVNIPQFELMLYQGDSLAWSSPVVVGKLASQTAIFQSTLNTIVFSPWWNVPPSITKNEILPGMARNPNYLAQRNMVMKDGWVRQRPGPRNSLGRVKFLFPNNFNMYLHDTPSKSLFERDKRAFSHGCVRVSEPRRLALYLLRDQPEWTPEKVDAAMASGIERYVTLKNPIQVSLVYFTSWVDSHGKIHFREDVYQRDERLMEMIFSKK